MVGFFLLRPRNGPKQTCARLSSWFGLPSTDTDSFEQTKKQDDDQFNPQTREIHGFFRLRRELTCSYHHPRARARFRVWVKLREGPGPAIDIAIALLLMEAPASKRLDRGGSLEGEGVSTRGNRDGHVWTLCSWLVAICDEADASARGWRGREVLSRCDGASWRGRLVHGGMWMRVALGLVCFQ